MVPARQEDVEAWLDVATQLVEDWEQANGIRMLNARAASDLITRVASALARHSGTPSATAEQ